ncbi:MAG TPA: sigma-70 family RNA polymerase sigma factor [Mycobacteriales bacterium]|nr:sigma-70 family RNA polymerase sigma factor [Mycobacteriales bacterium]
MTERKDPALAAVEPAMMTTRAVAPPPTEAPPGGATEFLQMVREHDPMLRALAWRLLGDVHLMDDALQEAYLKAFRSREAFRGDSAVGTWLYRITYNVCLDMVRARARRPADPLEVAAEAASSAPDPADVAASRTDLAAALAALPADQRIAVLLVDAEGMDYAAAADVLGVAPGTVGSRVSRGRAALRAALTTGDLR